MVETVDENFEFQKIVVVLGVTLLVIKYMAYFMTGSVAIFTDATESIVNVVAACVGIYALYLSAKPSDKKHPFGHGKVEVLSSEVEGSMIIAAGVIIMYETIMSFVDPDDITDKLDIGMILIALAAVANYVVGRAAIRKGKKNRSPALEASGKHLCSDTYSSIGILIGLVVVYVAESMGYDARWLDSSIAGVFGIIIIITGAGVLRTAVSETMDTADESILNEIASMINELRHDDWIDAYGLRVIKHGSKIFVNMKVVYPRRMTVDDIMGERQELADTFCNKYGDSIDASIEAIPCKPYNCRYCQRNCLYRSMDFEGSLEWTMDRLCARSAHAPGNFVDCRFDERSMRCFINLLGLLEDMDDEDRLSAYDRAQGAVHLAVDKIAYLANFALAIMMVLIVVARVMRVLDYDLGIQWNRVISYSCLLICGSLIIADEDRNLVRSVGLFAIGLGTSRVFYVISSWDPHQFTNLIIYAYIVLGSSMAYSGYKYITGKSRARTTMMASSILMFISYMIVLLQEVALGISIEDLLRTSPLTVIYPIMYFIYLSVLDSSALREKDWLVIQSRSLERLRRTYYLDSDATISDDDARILVSGMKDKDGWDVLSEGPVSHEAAIRIDNGRDSTYIIAQIWKCDNGMHLTFTDFKDGSVLQASRTTISDVELEGSCLLMTSMDGIMMKIGIKTEEPS